MQNDVLNGSRDRREPAPLAERSVERALAGRRAAYADEVHRLVEAGFALIRESGVLEPRVSAIVRRAGLSNHAFYKHFRSRDELLVAVLDDGIRQLASYLRHRMQRTHTPEERIRCWLEGLCQQALDPEGAAATRPFALGRGRLVERFPDEVAESERQLAALLREPLADAVASGALPRADPERDAAILYDLAMGWLQRKLAEPAPPRRADAEALIEFAMHGLRRGAG